MPTPENAMKLLESEFGVSRETLERLQLYHDELLRWQKKINLISPTTINDVWHRHILDSAQLASFIPTNASILDFGSGAGFPAMVLAIMKSGAVTMVESDQRKCAFLLEVKRLTNTEATICNERIEDHEDSSFDIITARACTALTGLLHYAEPFMGKDTICLFPKGKNYSIEIEEARRDWEFDVQHHPSLTEKDSLILQISNLKRSQRT